MFNIEYVTSAVSLLKGDGIVVHAINDSTVSENARMIIYRATGAGASVASDSDTIVVTPTFNSGLAFTVAESGEYWLRIRVTSECLIVKASFERLRDSVFVPLVSYQPGDFAIFRLQPSKTRLW